MAWGKRNQEAGRDMCGWCHGVRMQSSGWDLWAHRPPCTDVLLEDVSQFLVPRARVRAYSICLSSRLGVHTLRRENDCKPSGKDCHTWPYIYIHSSTQCPALKVLISWWAQHRSPVPAMASCLTRSDVACFLTGWSKVNSPTYKSY